MLLRHLIRSKGPYGSDPARTSTAFRHDGLVRRGCQTRVDGSVLTMDAPARLHAPLISTAPSPALTYRETLTLSTEARPTAGAYRASLIRRSDVPAGAAS